MDVLQVERVSKSFRGRAVLEDVSFGVGPGRVTGLIGLNGAGKTTLIEIVLGMLSADSGAVRLGGRRVTKSVGPAGGVGAVVEGLGNLGDVSLERGVAMWASLAGARCDARGLLKSVGLEGQRKARVSKISLGQFQRYQIALALLGGPGLLILDEPLNGLDPGGIHWLRGLLESQRQRGCGVLLSSHLLAELELVVDDVVVLQQGVLFAGSKDEFTQGGRLSLEQAFLGRVEPTADGSGLSAPLPADDPQGGE